MRRKRNKAKQQVSCSRSCDESCPVYGACPKRILIVGGMTKLKAHYRRLVESNGAIFDYHNGYIRGGMRVLEGRVRRSDMILCPVNCNSHSACLTVKRLCRKLNKPLHILSNASVSSISKALTGQQPVLN
jgi:hypothetical protein